MPEQSVAGSDIVVLGRLTGPYGVKGWMHVHSFADDPQAWCSLPVWLVAPSDHAAPGQWVEHEVAAWRWHGDSIVVSLVDVGDRTAAEALQGAFIGVRHAALPDTADGEYYWADLIGMRVVNQRGTVLGRVVSLMETGASQVLVVRAESGKEVLIPFVDVYVGEVDREKASIEVNWEEGW